MFDVHTPLFAFIRMAAYSILLFLVITLLRRLVSNRIGISSTKKTKPANMTDIITPFCLLGATLLYLVLAVVISLVIHGDTGPSYDNFPYVVDLLNDPGKQGYSVFLPYLKGKNWQSLDESYSIDAQYWADTNVAREIFLTASPRLQVRDDLVKFFTWHGYKMQEPSYYKYKGFEVDGWDLHGRSLNSNLLVDMQIYDSHNLFTTPFFLTLLATPEERAIRRAIVFIEFYDCTSFGLTGLFGSYCSFVW